MRWITDESKIEIRKVFEPRYKHPLTDEEVIAIGENLTQLLETFLKFKYRTTYSNS